MKREGWLILAALALVVLGRSALYGFILKPGVSGQLQPVMDIALDAVRRVWQSHGLTPVITSIQDGRHMSGSKHYEGLAFDVRLNNVNLDHEQLRLEVQLLAGNSFDIVHENHGTADDHLHSEYDPV